MQRVQPFLKWAGGKSQLLPELSKHIPGSYQKYIEPFLGGGALFFHLLPEKAVLADSNPELINCYLVVQNHIDELIKVLASYINDKDYYNDIRIQNPDKLGEIKRAARVIYLNKTCFNGLYRVNKSGQFNVPFGNRKNPLICDTRKLTAAHKALQGVKLVCASYEKVIKTYATPGDFVFFDPPYYPVSAYADFKRYTKESFYPQDHVKLRDVVNELVEKGVHVLLTNSNMEFIRELYKGYAYKVIETRRNISCDSTTRTGQDLIVIATQPKRKTSSALHVNEEAFLENFPGTRFMGSKYRVLPFIWEQIKDLKFKTVLDAFSGSGCVSYMLKHYGKKVTSNDFMCFCSHITKALIENNSVKLTERDIEFLLTENKKTNHFVANTFKGLYFSDKENEFIDSVRANIEQVKDKYKKSLAIAALSRACMKRRARGIFTYVGDRYDDGRKDMKLSLPEHFVNNVELFNKAVFDNGQKNQSFNMDILDLDVKADLVYFDPPYFTPKSDNDYCRRYHFVEGLARQWDGLAIQERTKTKKFVKYETPFSTRAGSFKAFDSLFKKFRNSILVVSYSSNSIPSKGELIEILKKYKREVIVRQIQHQYSFGTHSHKVGDNANNVLEYVFIGL